MKKFLCLAEGEYHHDFLYEVSGVVVLGEVVEVVFELRTYYSELLLATEESHKGLKGVGALFVADQGWDVLRYSEQQSEPQVGITDFE